MSRPPAEAQRCTCPSGDGSLRWPCPAHPPEAQAVGEVVLHDGLLYGRLVSDLPVGSVLYTAPPHPPPSVPVDMGVRVARLCEEASEVLEAVGVSGVPLPDNWRWPLADELSGTAAIVLNPTPGAPVGVEGAKAYCKECNAAGMDNCAHFDECGGARCITCRQQLNQPAQQPATVDEAERMAEVLREQKGVAGYERSYPDTGKTHRDYLAAQQGGTPE